MSDTYIDSVIATVRQHIDADGAWWPSTANELADEIERLAARCVSLERELEHVRGRYKARCAELNAAERERDEAVYATEEYKKLYVKASRQSDELQGSLLAAASRLAEVREFRAARLARDTALDAREGQS